MGDVSLNSGPELGITPPVIREVLLHTEAAD